VPTRALASPASAIVTISGSGFKSGAFYTCEFTTDTSLSPIVGSQAVQVVGARGRAASSRRVLCPSPHWATVEKPAKLRLFWGNCSGAGGVAAGCEAIDRVGDFEEEFEFEASISAVAPEAFWAGHAADAALTLWGGGFDADRSEEYLAQFGESGGRHVNVTGLTVAGDSVGVAVPRWGFAPNEPVPITLFDGARVIPYAAGGNVLFQFNTTWTDVVRARPRPGVNTGQI